MKRVSRLFVAISCIIIVTSCSGKHETLPGTDIPLSDMNQQVEILPDTGGNPSAKNNDVIVVDVQNISSQRIIFPGDYGVKLFYKTDDEWVDVENRMLSPEHEMVLPLATEFPPGGAFGVIPYIPELSQPVTLRIAVIGHLENNVQETVGAYVDIPLEP